MKKRNDLLTLVQLAMLISIQLVMKAIGLGSVPVGPLYMSFLTLPIAVGAILIGPLAGAILGGVFGAVSFYDAVTGGSVMGAALFQVSPIHTFILCVATRVLMGACTGFIFAGLARYDRKHSWSLFAGSFCAPFLNTLFFMGYLILIFYNTEFIQGLASQKGASNPIVFAVILVGVQAVIEWVACGILGGFICKALSVVLKNQVQSVGTKGTA